MREVSVIRRISDVSGGGEVMENDYSRIQLNQITIKYGVLSKPASI
jgi:hypothetical protein